MSLSYSVIQYSVLENVDVISLVSLQVQMLARSTLRSILSIFDDTSCLIRQLSENLKLDTTVHKERFKSTLTLLLECEHTYFMPFSSSFEQLKTILPLMVTSQPTEDIATIQLLRDSATKWFIPVNIEV